MAAEGPQLNGTINSPDIPTYTIIQADGLYPVCHNPSPFVPLLIHLIQDDTVEQEVFASNPPRPYTFKYLQTGLFPTGVPTPKPWSEVPKDLRDQVDGIMVLKMGFTEQDLALFPRLKV